ncbi:hypothetical protein EJB05_16973, partial [Eragrostis curvula]
MAKMQDKKMSVVVHMYMAMMWDEKKAVVVHMEMAPHPRYPLLDTTYDDKHRAHLMVDLGRDRKTTGVSSAWLAEHFSQLDDPQAEDWLVERYARAWLWHLIGGFLFPDGSGNTISWMVFPIVAGTWEDMATYSWASGVLAYLYRQLCDGCRRCGDSSGLGGCLYLLQ